MGRSNLFLFWHILTGRGISSKPVEGILANKSLLTYGFFSDSIYYYETLGSLRKPPEVSFKWGKQLGCRRTMGRQYFDSFVLHKQHLTVGDFVVHNANDGTNKLFKIVSAFQAIHSVHGIWTGTSRSRECLQKRGEQ